MKIFLGADIDAHTGTQLQPEGSLLSWVDHCAGRRWIWYSRSWNSARSRLKPVVDTLARLLEMVVRFMSRADSTGLADPQCR